LEHFGTAQSKYHGNDELFKSIILQWFDAVVWAARRAVIAYSEKAYLSPNLHFLLFLLFLFVPFFSPLTQLCERPP